MQKGRIAMKKQKKHRVLTVASLVSVIISIFLIFSVVIHNVTDTMFYRSCETNLEVFKQSEASLSSLVEDAQFLSLTVLGNEALISFLRTESRDGAGSSMEQYRLRFSFSSVFTSRDYLDSICIYNDDGILLQFGSLVTAQPDVYNEALRELGGRILWTAAEYHASPLREDMRGPVVSLYRAVNDLYAMDRLGYMRISIAEDALADCYESFNNAGSSRLMILDQQGQVVSARDKDLLGQNLSDQDWFQAIDRKQDGYRILGDTVCTFYHVENPGWYAVQLTPASYLHASGDTMRATLLVCMVLCVAIVLVFFILQRRAVRTEEAYKGKLLNREMELKYLQGQINPHFLYNTLDTIRWMAVRAKQDDIAKQIKALADIFRHTLNQGEEFTSVRAEVDHVRKYMFIQQNRFSDTLQYTIEIDARCLDATVPHLILQPIVENAVVHGLDGHAGMGTVAIRVYCEDDALYYEVTDNGVGFDTADVTRKMADPTVKHEVFALKNIDERIKLIYGDEYGLILRSRPGQGSCITAKMHLDR